MDEKFRYDAHSRTLLLLDMFRFLILQKSNDNSKVDMNTLCKIFNTNDKNQGVLFIQLDVAPISGNQEVMFIRVS